MKLNKITITAFLILLFLPFTGCKPSQEDFFELKKKQLELEQRVKNLEEENSKLKESIENFNPLRKFFENLTKNLPQEEATTQEPIPEYFEILHLEPFVVNLSDPGGKRYLKVVMSIELSSKELLVTAKNSTPEIRDQVINTLTQLSFSDVMTPDGKRKLRDTLIDKINEILKPSRISNLYFSEFVVQ